MCGRYQAWVEDDELVRIIEREKKGNAARYLQNNEVFPGSAVPVIYGSYANVRAHISTWGYTQSSEGSGSKILINARAETAKEKVTFADAVTRGRCLVPATGYFEWDTAKAKHRFTPADRGLLYMAGLCRKTPDGLRFVIITTSSAPVGAAAAVHPRMPLLIPALSADDWMRDTAFALRYLQSPAVGAVPLTAERVM